ncbi:ankyrin repeat domain-containing protein [Serratia nevei]|uniref:ankyrin repeat domain-containing protein n=1 Tax=Serratia nevei TaxID=2703794 RepID=UPI003F6C88F0
MKTLYLLFFLFVAPVMAIQMPSTANGQQVKQQLNNHLWNAARIGDGDVIESFITAKYNLNVQDENGNSAVILAAYHGHQVTVMKLLNSGADPCLQDKHGNTALMGAIFKGEVKIARLLIAAKCNPDTRNNAGQTAAMYASLFKQHALLAALKAKGANMHVTDANGNNVATLAQGEFRNR